MPKPNFSGVWRLSIVESVMKGDVPHELLMKIAHSEPEIRQQVLSVGKSGEQSAVFVFTIGADSANTVQGMPMTVRARWNNDELVIESRVTGRDMRFEDHWSLSSDGATLTMAHHDDPLAGQIAAFERGTEADAARF
jgi:hypothetical protein